MSEPVNYLIISIVAGAVIMKAGDIGEFIMSMITDTTVERNQRIVNKIDYFLANYGSCSSHTFDLKRPADGRHLYNGILFCRDTVLLGNISIVTYTIHTLSKSVTSELYKKIMQIEQTNNSIIVNSISSKSAWDHSVDESTKIIPTKMYPRQCDIITQMIERYRTNNNVSVLLSGKTGSGKTITGRFLCKILEQYNVAPILIEGYSPLKKGLPIDPFLTQATKLTPVILVIDEIDVAIASVMSERVNSSEWCSHADNKCELVKFLDKLRDTPYLYVIYSCNTPLDKLASLCETDDNACYISDYRMNIKYQFTGEQIRDEVSNIPVYSCDESDMKN